jgi:hypothetical protein
LNNPNDGPDFRKVYKKADRVYEYCKDARPGPITHKLYDTLLGIQYGDLPDKFGWIEMVN